MNDPTAHRTISGRCHTTLLLGTRRSSVVEKYNIAVRIFLLTDINRYTELNM